MPPTCRRPHCPCHSVGADRTIPYVDAGPDGHDHLDHPDRRHRGEQPVRDRWLCLRPELAGVADRRGQHRLSTARVSAGLVASSIEVGYDRMPTSPDNWFLGVLDEPIQRQVDLFISVTAPNGQRTISRAIMEVNVDGSYAINGWTVDPNASPRPRRPRRRRGARRCPRRRRARRRPPPRRRPRTRRRCRRHHDAPTTTVPSDGAGPAASPTRRLEPGLRPRYLDGTVLEPVELQRSAPDAVPDDARQRHHDVGESTCARQARPGGRDLEYFIGRFTKTFIPGRPCTITLLVAATTGIGSSSMGARSSRTGTTQTSRLDDRFHHPRGRDPHGRVRVLRDAPARPPGSGDGTNELSRGARAPRH